MRRFNPEKELYKIQHGNRNKTIAFVFLLLVIIGVSGSYALYQVRYSKRIIYTKVAPFSKYDLNLAIYVNGESKTEAPNKDEGYEFIGLICDKDYTGNVTWSFDTKLLTLPPIPIPNKCNAYFVSDDYYGISTDFVYNGEIQEFVASKTGIYKLEVWGAQGGGSSKYIGGLGGYSTGVLKLKQNDRLYVVVGGSTTDRTGGYNGGGTGGLGGDGYPNGYGGGGATHIATTTGLLKDLESNKESVLIVAGGGGGHSIPTNGCTLVGAGGGLTAGNGRSCGGVNVPGATTTSGFAFGLGQNGRDSSGFISDGAEGNGGGGGGYYGGYSYQGTGYTSDASGSGGSGYLSPSLEKALSQNGQNSGDGKAKITYLG